MKKREPNTGSTTNMAEESKKTAPSQAAPASPAAQSVGVRLVPASDCDLPILSNFARVQLSPSGVLVDFGFIEAAGLAGPRTASSLLKFAVNSWN